HFLVLYGATDQERAEAEQEIQRQVAGAHLVGPVIYRTGTFALVTSFRKENDELVKEVVGMGKAPIMEGHKASVSMHLTQKGATLLWESFRNPTSQISVTFEMEARGYRNPYEATLEADWKKISNSHRVSVGAKYKWLGVDVDLLFQEFRKTGALKLEVKGKSEEMDKIWQKAFDILMRQMFEKDETLDALSSLQKGDSGFNNLNRAMDFLKKDQERKAKEKGKTVASFPLLGGSSLLPILSNTGDSGKEVDSQQRFWGPSCGVFNDEESTKNLGIISYTEKQAIKEFDENKLKLALEHQKKANGLVDRGKYGEGIAEYKECYKICPVAMFFFDIAYTYYHYLYDAENAIEYWNKFLKEAEGQSYGERLVFAREHIHKLEMCRSHFKKALNYLNQDKFKLALLGFLEVYEEYPTLNTIFNISSCYMNLNDSERALEYCQRWLEKYGPIKEYIRKEKFEKMVMERIEKFSPENSSTGPDVKDITGEVSEKKQEDEQKVKKAKEYFKKGKKYYGDGLFKKAIEEFENSYKEYPRPETLYNIGYAYEKIAAKGENSEENYKKAVEYFEKSIEGFKKEGTSSQKDAKDAETKIANIKAAVKDIISKREKAKEAETKKTKAVVKAKTPAKKAGETKKGKAKLDDKKKAPAKQPKKVEKGKGDESSPGFAIIASYHMRRIKHSGKAVINLNQ
ncbi:MAG: hypothetical protein U9Q97_07585, partial [Acidobacteriota bacterium]|nr:hypothetical protein [Acidobacteriota bacterium]